MLQETKINILFAFDGQQAVDLCLSKPNINVVLMDIQLPGISGLEATRRIREKRPEITIIAQTAFAMNEDRNRCLEYGCNDYITKPYSPKGILNLINKFLN